MKDVQRLWKIRLKGNVDYDWSQIEMPSTDNYNVSNCISDPKIERTCKGEYKVNYIMQLEFYFIVLFIILSTMHWENIMAVL